MKAIIAVILNHQVAHQGGLIINLNSAGYLFQIPSGFIEVTLNV